MKFAKNSEQILNAYKKNTIGLEKAVKSFQSLLFEDLGFAKIDHNR